MEKEQPLLKVENVSKSFGGVQALLDVSFEIHKGEILGIIGPNGSGKTTLLNCVTSFVKRDRGSIYFRGKELKKNIPPHKVADMGIARTFQITRPYHSLPAFKNLVIPLLSPRARRTGGWRGGGKHGDRDTVGLDILEEIGFERDSHIPYKMASALPTGYLKRLELARCLAIRPELVFCDEIFSGLSASEIATMTPLVEKLQMEGVTLIMIEHRLRELFRVANRIMVLNFGEKITEGTAEKVMADERVKEAYFGSDQEVMDYA